MIMNKTIMKCMVLGLLFAGCENGDKEFDDYEYQTISFATQTPHHHIGRRCISYRTRQ